MISFRPWTLDYRFNQALCLRAEGWKLLPSEKAGQCNLWRGSDCQMFQDVPSTCGACGAWRTQLICEAAKRSATGWDVQVDQRRWAR